ncbi:CRTAC1 family protein [Occallatibacter savannae]|uniref:CRTAC1 family protein n=1 Tax=Occallatibacter savannae TaxID=1002691 RepID=UPI000D68F1A1|nr:CRTAC1 family protein [Occallatibacter savannae]
MPKPLSIAVFVLLLLSAVSEATRIVAQQQSPSPIKFELKSLPFRLDSDESSTARNVPETMAGGVAVFDYNSDGRPDIFFTNGASLQTLKKTSDKQSDRLYRNDGNGVFTDVTAQAGLHGRGFDSGVAAGDYDNDGHPDLFVMSVHGNTLYHNNGDGTFADVTRKAGLDKSVDPDFGPLYGVAAAWVDVNNDGLLDLFVVNYLQWTWSDKPLCTINNVAEYCHPRYYKGLPDQLFLNNGDGTFKDVSKEWGIRDHVGKGMGVGVADFDLDGKPDLFVTNDAGYSFLFHNLGNKFEEIAFQANIALPEEGAFISGMGLDFRDFDNDGYPDVAYVALNRQTFPLFRNTGKGDFTEVTAPSGMTSESLGMSGFGPALYDFDNDGWKDLFVSRGHVSATHPPGAEVKQPNSVFRNLGANGKWQSLTEQAGFAQSTAARHRGCALGDFDGDGRIDIVATSMDANAELWMNRSPAGHWLDIALHGTKSNRDGIGARIKVVTKSGTQYNHQTSSVCYASSSLGPVHFGLGPESKAQTVQITWPSGVVQTLEDVDGDRILKVTETAPAATPK